MKNILSLGLMILVGHLAFSQSNMQNDPSYSIHNYKHPNKAKYAKEQKMDQSTSIVVSDSKQNDNYKQSFKKTTATTKHAVTVGGRKNTNNKSYKHPYGL